MREWVWELNNALGLDPARLLQGSDKKAFWDYPCGHRAQAQINRRVAGNGCKICGHLRSAQARRRPKPGGSLAELAPALAAEWDTERNEIGPDQIAAQSNIPRHWICPEGHYYDMRPNARYRGRNCPYCRGLRVGQGNDLATKRPDLAREWDIERNGQLSPDQVTPASHKQCHWACAKNPIHRWTATPSNRRTRGCPYCANRFIDRTNNLSATHPTLAIEWNDSRNFPKVPTQFVRGSSDLAWWTCRTCDHIWRASIASRACGGQGCPPCGRLRTRNALTRPAPGRSIAAAAPDLAAEWHPSRNELTPHELGPGSGIEVWWQCFRGHSWLSAPDTRTRMRSGCEKCQMGSTSALEIRNFAELAHILKHCGFSPEHGARIPHLPRSIGAVDMLFVDEDGSQPGIIVEFDGAWWHDNKRNRADTRKTDTLIDAGFGVIRIRESPLLPVTSADVLVPKNQDAYLTSSACLTRMLELDWIPSNRRGHITHYCSLGTSQAAAEATIMIDRRGGYDLAMSAARIRARQGSRR
ncbi:zinc-ribbon domain-containing protein [Streptomyces venezuelae]|uniref:zinc-ribbon domain-containing protein n=1 Tax=Streptomyces venezuelae TaxID=54571 RepID=UPI003326A72B